MNAVYILKKPDYALPLIFDSPHSGRDYPDDFGFVCPQDALMHDEDRYVEDLFSKAPEYKACLLYALFPRTYMDVNRRLDDIDTSLLDAPWPFGPVNPTIRSDSGIGLIWRLVKPGIPLYDGPLKTEDIAHRIERYYKPYHEALKTLIEEAHYHYGHVWHINCHSMSSSAAVPRRQSLFPPETERAVDFCLGNLDGRSCSLELTHAVRDFLKDKGYRVSLNDPFKGVELIKRHAAPTSGRHSLQIEINKALYMDEKTGDKNRNYNNLKNDIENLIEFCTKIVEGHLIQKAAD